MDKMIYLDYASHTPADSAVIEEFCRIEAQYIGNPSANHEAGRLALLEMERITSKIADMLGVRPSEIIYTSGASESNNLAIKGIARAYRHKGKHILSTCLDHPSVSGALTALQQQGYEIELIDLLPDGTVDLDCLQSIMRNDTIMLSICHTDSELGAVQPMRGIVEILKNYPDCRLIADAAQAIGKIPVSIDGVSCLSFAPHKFYGLCGCGVLFKRDGVILEPLIHGGMSTTIYRSGTPALGLAASICTALELAMQNERERFCCVKSMRMHLIEVLKKYPLVRINSPINGSPYILNLSVKGVKGDDFQAALDKRGVFVSVKSACSTPGLPSRPVFAVSGDKKNAVCSWRISLSHLTEAAELDGFLAAFDECYKELTNI